MEVRPHVVGSERGMALAIGVGLSIAILVAATEPPMQPPFEPGSAAYVTVVGLYALPAVFVGAYGGGVIAGWVVEIAPAVAMLAVAVGGSGVQSLRIDPVTAGLALVAAAIVLGTVGVLVGRGLRTVWDSRVA